MKPEGQTPAEKSNQKAAEEMKRAVDRTIDAEKSNGHFGNEQGKREAAESLKKAAEKASGKKAP